MDASATTLVGEKRTHEGTQHLTRELCIPGTAIAERLEKRLLRLVALVLCHAGPVGTGWNCTGQAEEIEVLTAAVPVQLHFRRTGTRKDAFG
jgi:hypothetical protein